MPVDPEKKRALLRLLRTRRAICGACGCDEEVTLHMQGTREFQFTARPDEETDVYYCGCQNENDQEMPPWWF